jgi:hypothetical protein
MTAACWQCVKADATLQRLQMLLRFGLLLLTSRRQALLQTLPASSI